MEPILSNEKYEIYLLGNIERWTRSGTSDHYYDYTDHYEGWRGQGALLDKSTGVSVQFGFGFNAGRNRSVPQALKDLLLHTDRERKGFHPNLSRWLSVSEVVLPDRQEEVVNFIFERILSRVNAHPGPVKVISLDPIPHAELVERGLAADWAGQVHLPLATVS